MSDAVTTNERALLWLSVRTLWWRELVRFIRQRSRVIGALATPLLFWLLIGSGIGASFRPADSTSQTHNYLEYFFPGTLVLILLFTAIFSTISVIDDRKQGFLQGVLVAPVGRGAILAAKVLGGATLAVGQAALVLLLAPLVGIPLTIGAFALTVLTLIVVAVALTAMGFIIAWQMDSTQGFHAIMNVFLIPLWLLSGAVFPPSGSADWLAWLVRVNPLYYGLALIRRALYLAGDAGTLPSIALSLPVTILYAAVMIGAAAWLVNRDRTPS